MPPEGLVKYIFVGGWAIRKELEHCRKFIRQNLYSQSTTISQSVLTAYTKCELLEDNVIVQYFWLKDNTKSLRTGRGQSLSTMVDNQRKEIEFDDLISIFSTNLECSC